MRYAYQRGGAPILDWTNGPPRQSRAADSVALGSLGGGTTLDHPTLVLPAPGAPEPVGITPRRVAMGGCSCSGSCGCGSKSPAAAALSGIADSVPGGYLTLGVAAYFLAWKFLFKKRR